jgi:hypothetical protein
VIDVGGGWETDDDVGNDEDADANNTNDNKSGIDPDDHHDILFCLPPELDPQNGPVTPPRPM